MTKFVSAANRLPPYLVAGFFDGAISGWLMLAYKLLYIMTRPWKGGGAKIKEAGAMTDKTDVGCADASQTGPAFVGAHRSRLAEKTRDRIF
ncbi:MAG: hypothetical protein ACP5SG_06995 [Dissulfurimicrobium sp.]|uniref:hypothetical protein n=1 Tax=Dissulfurimicrobium sp. TaxID=2022436 RepID=UPI003D0DAE7E